MSKPVILVVDVSSIDDTDDMDSIVNQYLTWTHIYMLLSIDSNGEYACPPVTLDPDFLNLGTPQVKLLYVPHGMNRFHFVSGFLSGSYDCGTVAWFYSQTNLLSELECLEQSIDIQFQITREAMRPVETPEASSEDDEECDNCSQSRPQSPSEEQQDESDDTGEKLVMSTLMQFMGTKQGMAMLQKFMK